MGDKRNLVGKSFGNLTVITDTKKRRANGCRIWCCQCNLCGRYSEFSSTELKSEADRVKCDCEKGRILVGESYGHVKVVAKTPFRHQTRKVFFCECECGKTVFFDSRELKKKKASSLSCGCKKELRG